MNQESAATPVEDAVEADVSVAVALFRSLADPARLAILRHLTLGEHRVVDLTAHLGLAQSTTSAHLACLRDCGLVSVRTVGRSSVYSLAVESELMGVFGVGRAAAGRHRRRRHPVPDQPGRVAEPSQHEWPPVTGHSHDHGAGTATGRHRRRLVAVLGINAGVLVLQVIGGLASGSLALLADAGPHADRLDRTR